MLFLRACLPPSAVRAGHAPRHRPAPLRLRPRVHERTRTMTHMEVSPEILRWAAERSGLGIELLHRRFPRLPDWVRREESPTLRQLEQFAKATHTPIGYLFLQEPPVERLPIPDFRATDRDRIRRPSADLLDTVYLCQQRQEWFCEYAGNEGLRPLGFVGSARLEDSVEITAAAIRTVLGLDLAPRREDPRGQMRSAASSARPKTSGY
jgi:hypothetical protein